MFCCFSYKNVDYGVLHFSWRYVIKNFSIEFNNIQFWETKLKNTKCKYFKTTVSVLACKYVFNDIWTVILKWDLLAFVKDKIRCWTHSAIMNTIIWMSIHMFAIVKNTKKMYIMSRTKIKNPNFWQLLCSHYI